MPLPSAAGASPAMAQWFAAKDAHPDALLFFRMGDFYELFFDDAEAAAAALDIALTARGEHAGQPIPMCGVPAHAAEAYLARLIRRGYRVAVAEQMEDAAAAAPPSGTAKPSRGGGTGKAPIRREVVRLVTPGTLVEDALLDAARPNLLLALARVGDALGAAWLDVSTGAFETEGLASPTAVPALLGRLDPAEILAPAAIPLPDMEGRRGPETVPAAPLAARRRAAETFGVASLDAFGAFSDAEAVAACLALDYVRASQGGQLPRLQRPVPAGQAGQMEMDAATRASLEIVRARDGAGPTLLSAVRRTLTAPGHRKLADWLSAPLLDPAAIAARQEGWLRLLAHPDAASRLRAALRTAPDMARALGRLSLGQRWAPRDLGAIRDGLRAAALADAPLAATDGLARACLGADGMDALRVDPALTELLARALAEELPARAEDGGVIAPGYDGELDGERGLRDGARRHVAGLALDYAQRYGVASLKIRHHAQLGYLIEAPQSAVDALRAHPDLVLRQAMAGGARFSNPELAELDRRINEAADRAAARERVVLAHLVRAVLDRADAVAACADALARLDVLQGAAALAEGGDWCRPEVDEGVGFCVTAGRHPVVEAALAGHAPFVANDCDLSPHRRVLLLTGPNMAGKSTYLRQNALAAVLAQAGLPVPAKGMRLGVVDRLYSRVGAADDLARGRSTFMVEMTETASILNGAGPRSLVVVDEIGRGTGTQDGLAIATAVLEALHDGIRCRAIFATHFHELARLSARLPRLCPHAMRVKEWKGGVVFLHEVGEGAAGRSWGVHVARLAGVPPPVVRRAAALLAGMENGAADLPLFAAAPISDPETTGAEKDLTSDDGPTVAAAGRGALLLAHHLAALDPDKLTPREALEAVYRLKSLLAEAGPG